MKRARYQQGSVVQDRRRKVWNYLFCENGVRRTRKIGSLRDYPTKAAAWRAAEKFKQAKPTAPSHTSPLVKTLIEQFRNEKMPTRIDTRRSYNVWLRCHILPRFGDCPLNDVQARTVELWLNALSLSPKSKVHIRGLLRLLWDYAQWRGDVAIQRNPMELVSVKNATQRARKPRSLTVEEFRKFVVYLEEPFRTLAVLCVCLGLRISEALALKWSDVDWLGGRLQVDRAIICQNVGDVKTAESRKPMPLDPELLAILKVWHGSTQFTGIEDWLFASPLQLGRLPWSYDQIWRVYQKAATASGIGPIGTHSLRHTFRAWLAAVGTTAEVQRRLMRHSDPAMALKYGDIVTDEMERAQTKVVALALN